MLVTVENIPEQGLEVHASEADAWVRRAAAAALDSEAERVRLDVTVRRLRAGRVRVVGRASVELTRPCDRCGAPLRLRLAGETDLAYDPVEPGEGPSLPRERELPVDELDVGWYEGPALDLGQVLSEQLALWLPATLRCDTDGATRLDGGGACRVPAQPPMPAEERRSPFAALLRSE